MHVNSTTKIYFPANYKDTNTAILNPLLSTSIVKNSKYANISLNITDNHELQIESTIERVAQWFLSISPMSNKKLQKLCYYAYCWYIVFFNDIESITKGNSGDIQVLCADRFQAWIHGPVSPRLYHRYKEYGWHDIPQVTPKPAVSAELESLFQQVWEAYGSFTADDLESISHRETPWINARNGIQDGEACSNEISNYDILMYYSSLG